MIFFFFFFHLSRWWLYVFFTSVMKLIQILFLRWELESVTTSIQLCPRVTADALVITVYSNVRRSSRSNFSRLTSEKRTSRGLNSAEFLLFLARIWKRKSGHSYVTLSSIDIWTCLIAGSPKKTEDPTPKLYRPGNQSLKSQRFLPVSHRAYTRFDLV